MVEALVAGLPRRVWGVSALLVAMGDLLASRFSVCSVRGELSGFARAASGHCYFTLKDTEGASASLRCAMFRRTTLLLDFAPRDGQLVELRGRVALYEPRGELQFVAESMRPAGAGALYERFLALQARLEAEGLFEAAGKQALPPRPGCIGIVTSLHAAALHDVLTTLARRAPHLWIVIYPSLVQGMDAPESLVRALRLAERRAEVDVLIVCRGGGSLEDLWAFNDERVVRAIAACPIPVISGVGHETDVTLADFAADLRATTPTAAAELAAPARDALLADLTQIRQRLARATQHRLETLQQRLDRVSLRLARPDEAVAREGRRLVSLARRIEQSTAGRIQRGHASLERAASTLARAMTARRVSQQHELRQLTTRLEASNPRHVLARGYALIHTAEGELVRSAAQIEAGCDLHLMLAQGEAGLRVAAVTPSPFERGEG